MTSEEQPVGMMSGVLGITRRDLLLAWKRPGDILNPLFFFAMVAALFPLAIEQFEDTLRCCHCCLQCVVFLGQVADRSEEAL